MPIINYILPDGATRDVEVAPGRTVMEGSVRNNLPGIVAECGGSCSCATCHVEVLSGIEHFDEITDEERDLLEFLGGATPASRLACQLVVTPACTGVRIRPHNNEG